MNIPHADLDEVAAVFWMIKANISEHLRSKQFVSQVNELLMMAIVHNLMVLGHAIETLGLVAQFWPPANNNGVAVAAEGRSR